MLASRRRAFTLTELLIVMVAVSILAVTLFPAFIRARESAQDTSCVSNLQQIGLSFMQYAQDHDRKLPRSFSQSSQKPPGGVWGGTSPNYYWFWQNTIYPYVKKTEIFVCPNGDRGFAVTPYRGNYGVNGFLIKDNSSTSLEDVKTPSTTYMVTDAGTYRLQQSGKTYIDNVKEPRLSFWYLPGTAKYAVDPGFTGFAADDFKSEGRHFDGNNVVFADGHVKWVKTATMWNEDAAFAAGSYAATTQSAWNPANSG
jgi:prepilin-type N-terminal cleavage/methylation domain-containing protein/prepilin-type processing-associated H-X9-DG protein